MINILSYASKYYFFMKFNFLLYYRRIFDFLTSIDSLPFLINAFVGEKNDFIRVTFVVDEWAVAD